MEQALQHHGILGMKWGKTNGPPYPLDNSQRSAEERRLAKKDTKWIKRKEEKIKAKVIKKSAKDIKQMTKNLDQERSRYNSNGQLSSNYINEYNRRLADIMNTKVGDVESPSGKVVRFVAKRGEIGVYTALADKGYDMQKVKNGVWDSGRVGYKKEELGMIHDGIQNGMDFLEHHGILGQRWGKRNGPPYPLGVGERSSSEYNKAGEKFHLSDKQKTYIKRGALITAGLLAATGVGYVAVKSGKLPNAKNLNMLGIENLATSKAGSHIVDSAKIENIVNKYGLDKINPDTKDSLTGNCVSCSGAGIARLLGHANATARSAPVQGKGFDYVRMVEKGFHGKFENLVGPLDDPIGPKKATTLLVSKLQEQGEGAVGFVCANKPMGQGHAIFYKVVNNEVCFFESQSKISTLDGTGKVINGYTDIYSSYLANKATDTIKFARIDNIKDSWDYNVLKEFINNL